MFTGQKLIGVSPEVNMINPFVIIICILRQYDFIGPVM